MSTRSNIIAKLSDGSWKRIYCHWDGYPSHNGRILFQSYSTQQKVDALMKHGDLSSLAPQCTKPRGHSFANKKEGFCVYYGRDRGEANTAGTSGDSLHAVWPDENTWAEFVYVWDGEKWQVGDPSEGTQTLACLQTELTRVD